MILPVDTTPNERPWAIERVSNLPTTNEASTIGPVKRFVARLLPRRR
jgi:hypothetical protein